MTDYRLEEHESEVLLYKSKKTENIEWAWIFFAHFHLLAQSRQYIIWVCHDSN